MTISGYEVPDPILNSPFEEPQQHWRIEESAPPLLMQGRRLAMYFYKPPAASANGGMGYAIELKLVNLIRERIKDWKAQGYPGASRVTTELLSYWQREGRRQRLFFAQIEAAESIIFLKEARSDYLQGIDVPFEDIPAERQAEGLRAFRRYALKMATGSGKTTVMGMLAAWSILNKVTQRGDSRFSDVVLVVCPNVTIRRRLAELDPQLGEASLYRTRDLVPHHLMPDLIKGRVFVTNWHVFEPKTSEVGGASGRVVKTGEPVSYTETIRIGTKTTTARGKRYLTPEELERQMNAGIISIRSEKRDTASNLVSVEALRTEYVESETALVQRVLGREIGGKQNILVFNDEAHHAYRIQREMEEDSTYTEDFLAELLGEEEDAETFTKEATVWVEGLDKINKLRSINFCVDLSATPYYLGRVGQQTNRIFPWTISDFGLTDAIESGLVKIPQLAIRDTTGTDVPGYFNIWKWILDRLTPAERGARGGTAKPEAILKWGHTPIVMLAGLWEQMRLEWQESRDDPRPPVFILVCKNTKIAKVIYEWLAENNPPVGVPPAGIEGFLNRNDKTNTIRVDSRVVEETDTGEAKSDESSWMRFTLDTVGKLDWARDNQGRPLYPEGFEDLAKKLGRPTHPPGRDIRCIVSVGMLTEGWDCNTVTHVIGLRPFMSQLLCEQVVGRALRRTNYSDFTEDGKLKEEVAKIFGVPFEIIPFKANPNTPVKPDKRHHVHAVPQKADYEILYPRVQGYRQAIRNRIAINWKTVAPLTLDPLKIPPEVQMKASLMTNSGRPSLMGPGRLESVDLNPYRSGHRFQELVFELAKDLTRVFASQVEKQAPAHVLFPQLVKIVEQYLREHVYAIEPCKTVDVFLSPYYGWVIENLLQSIHPDVAAGESPEVPVYETNRGPGSTSEVSYWTSRDVREVLKSHLNYVVADTKQWEQSAAYILDTYPAVEAFVKNAGLGFAIPYLHNGQMHDYVPDFIIRLKDKPNHYLILETKGYDENAAIKANAAERWVRAVNADGKHGHWQYAMALRIEEVREKLNQLSSLIEANR